LARNRPRAKRSLRPRPRTIATGVVGLDSAPRHGARRGGVVAGVSVPIFRGDLLWRSRLELDVGGTTNLGGGGVCAGQGRAGGGLVRVLAGVLAEWLAGVLASVLALSGAAAWTVG